MDKTEHVETELTEHAETGLDRHEERVKEAEATAQLKQHKAMVEKSQADPLLDQPQITVEKKELTGFRIVVKNYFAEMFLASMYIIGMLLAVIYMLAHTWN